MFRVVRHFIIGWSFGVSNRFCQETVKPTRYLFGKTGERHTYVVLYHLLHVARVAMLYTPSRVENIIILHVDQETLAMASTVTTATTKPLHVLRGLLRTLKRDLPADLAKKAPSLSTVPPTRAFVLQQYRASRHVDCPQETAHLRQLAADFLQLQKDLLERKRLYELDAGAEAILTPKEMSRRAAARAGLQIPELDPKLE